MNDYNDVGLSRRVIKMGKSLYIGMFSFMNNHAFLL